MGWRKRKELLEKVDIPEDEDTAWHLAREKELAEGVPETPWNKEDEFTNTMLKNDMELMTCERELEEEQKDAK